MKWFLNLTTRSKLLLGFGALFVLLLVVAASGLIEVRKLVRAQRDLFQNQFTTAVALKDIRVNQNGLRSDVLTMLLSEDAAVREDSLRDMQQRAEAIDRNMSAVLAGLGRQPGLAPKVREFARVRSAFEKTRLEQVLPALEGGKPALAKSLVLGMQAQRNQQMRVIADELVAQASDDVNAAISESERLAARIITVFLVCALLAVLVGLIAVAVLTRAIANPLLEISRIAECIAARNLRVDIQVDHRHDEVGSLGGKFRNMVENLRTLTGEIQAGVEVLGAAAAEIVSSTTQVASGAAETAAAINQTGATLEQVRQTTQLATQKAKYVSDTAQKTAQVSESGRKAVEDTIAAMNRIRQQMDSIAAVVVRLSEQGQAIGEIIATVNDLAEQSNLLAVNAAIEAAKAGDYGRGFGVVAQEVRSLAEQSKQATAQVRTMLGEIQKATSTAVMTTEQGSKAVEAGAKQAAEASESIRLLAESIAEVAQAAAQILASAQQQSAGVDQVALAAANIKQASAQNLASTRQAETAARNLHDLGHKLQVLVQQYQL
jgi:methyl-accepting chemotaxis protein